MEDKSFLNFFKILWKKKHFRVFLKVMMAVGILALIFPGWLVYYKPAFRGRVLDAETGEPLEGAVVVAQYYSHPIFTIHGGGSEIIKLRETLTDKDGEFRIMPYVRLISPNSIEYDTEFVIFKAGYGSYPNYQTSPDITHDEDSFFSEKFGTDGKLERWGKTEKVTFGVVRLPKLRTWKERRNSRMVISIPKNKLPLLNKALKMEYDWLYKKNNRGDNIR